MAVHASRLLVCNDSCLTLPALLQVYNPGSGTSEISQYGGLIGLLFTEACDEFTPQADDLQIYHTDHIDHSNLMI